VNNFVTYLLAFTVTATLIHFLSPQAVRIGLVDRPHGRKQHTAETPLVGGLAIFFGFYISVSLAEIPVSNLPIFMICSLALVIMGVFDDLRDLSFKPRLMVQVLAALGMCFWGKVILQDLGHLGWDDSMLTLGALAIPFTVFATVGVINAVNMSDGLDGLSGSLTLVALGGLAALAALDGRWTEFEVVFVLSFAVAGFLLFNARVPSRVRALVFLGDSGSMFLGFAIAWFLISFSQGSDRIMSPVTALWLVAVPLCDTVGIMLRRILKGRSPFAADREHFHHILQLAGYSVSQVNLIIGSIAIICMALGIVGHVLQVSDAIMFVAFLTVFAAYFSLISRAWKVMRFLRRQLRDPSASIVAQNAADARESSSPQVILFKAKSELENGKKELLKGQNDLKELLEERMPVVSAQTKAAKGGDSKNQIAG